MRNRFTFDEKQLTYRAPYAEIAELPLRTALCEASGDLTGVEEEDAGLTWTNEGLNW